MKAKKLMAAFSAIVMSTAMCFSVTGCKDKHSHSVADSDWKVTTAPTCEAEGEAEGKCSCGETLTKKLDALGHSYGDWQISKPTASAGGKAAKTCSTDANHKVEVNLPAIKTAGNKYTVSGSGVEKTYTYAHDLGNIVFSQYMVADAAEIAAESSDSVIKGNINLYGAKYSYESVSGVANPNKYDEEPKITDADIVYEFGVNCAHYVDDTFGTDTWYEKTEGGIFSYMSSLNNYYEMQQKPVGDASEDNLKGYSLGFTYYGGGHKEFGVERYIAYLYECALENPNGDFKEEVKEVEGKVVYTFSFSELQDMGNAPQHIDGINLGRSLYLHVNEVEFTLNDDFIVETASISNTLYMVLFNEETAGSSKWVATPQIEEAADGTWHVKKEWKDKPMHVETFTVTQKSELAAGESKPVNPLKEEDLKATSFELWKETTNDVRVEAYSYHGKDVLKLKRDENGLIQYGLCVINSALVETSWTPSESEKYENGTIEVAACVPQYFSLRNVAPTTANFSYDNVKIYLRTTAGDELLSSSYDGGDDGHIKASFNPAIQAISLNFFIAGEQTIVIKTENCEKVVKFNVTALTPSKLSSRVYTYDDLKEQASWNDLTKDFTVYAGQPLYFTAQVAHPAYEVTSYTASVSGEETVVLTDAEKDDVAVKKFVANTEGLYTVTLKSTASEAVTTKIRINVQAAPAVSDLLNAEYENTDKTSEVSLTLTASAEGATTGSATLKIGGTDGDTATFNYSYNDIDKTIAVTDVSGALTNVGLELTEGYKLVLTYTEGPGNARRVLLKDVNEVINELVGVHKLTTEENAVEFEVAVEGMYTVSLTGNGFYKYVKNGTVSDFQMGASTIELVEGDTLKVFKVGDVGEDEMFYISYKAKSSSNEGYGFAGTSWKGKVGAGNATINFIDESSGTFTDSMSVNSDTFEFTVVEDGGTYKLNFTSDGYGCWYILVDSLNDNSYFTVDGNGKVETLVLTLLNDNGDIVSITMTKQ